MTTPSSLRTAIASAAAIGLSVAVLSACGQSDSSSATDGCAKTTTIQVNGSVPSVSSLPIYAAQDEGFFAKNCVKVNVRSFPSGVVSLQSFQSGQGDMVITGDLPSLTAPEKVGSDYKLITPLERDSASYVAVVKSSITQPSQLKGTTIGTAVGSTGSYWLYEYLKRNNVPEDSVKVVNMNPGDLPSAIDRGDIDGFFIYEPFGSLALSASGSKVHQLTNADGYIDGYGMLGGRTSWLKKNATAAEEMVKALNEGADWVHAHPADAKKLAIKETKLDPDYVDKAMAWSNWPFAFDKTFYDDYTAESAYAVEAGLMKKPVDFSSWIWPDAIAKLDPSRVASPPAS